MGTETIEEVEETFSITKVSECSGQLVVFRRNGCMPRNRKKRDKAADIVGMT